PPVPGLFNALGLLWAPLEYHLAQAARIRLGRPEAAAELARVLQSLTARAGTLAGGTPVSLQLRPSADVNYAGQFHSLTIELRDTRVTPAATAALQRDFETEHQRAFGYVSDGEPIEIRAIRVAASPKRKRAEGTNLVAGL